MGNKNKFLDIIVIGFALFAIFFGAGNLIFPPYLGVISGTKWVSAIVGFLVTDPILPVVAIIATALVGGKADDMGKRVGVTFAKIIQTICILIIGAFFASPRTAATTHDVAVKQLFPGVPGFVTSIVFFAIVVFFTLNPGEVINKIGKILTPALLIILFLIIIKAVIFPIGPVNPPMIEGTFLKGFTEGYNTMDALAGALFAGLVISDLVRKGYVEKNEQFKMLLGVGLVAVVLLALVYGGLTFIGACMSSYYQGQDPSSIERVPLLIDLVTRVFGQVGKAAIGLAVTLACLTTAIGLASTCGEYFENLSGGKLTYKPTALATIAVAFLMSLIGTEKIINVAVPVLLIIYPIFMCLVFFSLFDSVIKYNWTYTGAVALVIPYAIITSLHDFFQIKALDGIAAPLSKLPLTSAGFGWLLPAIVGSVVFTIIAVIVKGPTKPADAQEAA